MRLVSTNLCAVSILDSRIVICQPKRAMRSLLSNCGCSQDGCRNRIGYGISMMSSGSASFSQARALVIPWPGVFALETEPPPSTRSGC